MWFCILLIPAVSLSFSEGPEVISSVSRIYGRAKENVTFTWYYKYTEPIHLITFNRKSENTGKVYPVGHLQDGIFSQTLAGTGRVFFQKKGSLEGQIYLTLLNITSKDYNLNYTCTIIFNDRESSFNQGIFLSGGPEVFSNMTSVYGLPKGNVQFAWYYKYAELIHTIIFNRKNERKGKMFPSVGFWEDSIFTQTLPGERDRVVVDKTGTLEGQIILTLLNTTADDYNWNYTCRIIFNDKASSSINSIYLDIGPYLYSNVSCMYGRPTEDITFNWYYKSIAPIDHIIFNRKHERYKNIFQLGSFRDGVFKHELEDKSKVVFNKTGSLQGQIELKVLNTTFKDYNLKYTCQIVFNDKVFEKSIFLVGDCQWKDNPRDVKVSIGDDVTLTWEYVNTVYDQNILVYRKNGKMDSFEDLGKWENEKLSDNGYDQRMEFNITKSGDDKTAWVVLTIHNTTIEDFKYTYNVRAQFNHMCIKYAGAVSLIEAPRLCSHPEVIEGKPRNDIKLVWVHVNRYVATDIRFNKSNELRKQYQIGDWTENRFNRNDERFKFDKHSIPGGEEITLRISKTIDEDFNTIYGCNVTFSNGLSSYDEIKLIYTHDVEPKMTVPNKQIHGRIGETATLIFTYYYRYPAINISLDRTYTTGLHPGTWTDILSVIDVNRRIFNNRSILGGGQISLIILSTTIQDYDAIYKCQVTFTNDLFISKEITLLLEGTIEDKGLGVGLTMMTVSLISALVIILLVGFAVCVYKRKAKRVVNTSSNPINNMRHSYISLNSVVIFHANRDSTTTNAESTASNDTDDDTDDDTDAYANPYDPINRDGIDTSKNFYMSLQNPGTSNINQGEDVQETEVDDNSVTNINDVQTADDDDDDDDGDDGDDDDDDDDISTHDSSPYDALNTYTMNSDIHSYLSLPPCTCIVEDLKIVKKRPSTI